MKNIDNDQIRIYGKHGVRRELELKKKNGHGGYFRHRLKDK